MSDHPASLVSVLIPAYKPTFFEETLRSVLNQSYPHLETIICDDSRGDEIEKITTEIAANHSNITYLRNPETLGELENFQKCFEESSGTYIKFLSDDDVLQPDCIETLVGALDSHPRVRLATSRRTRIDEHGRQMDDMLQTLPLVCQSGFLEGTRICAHIARYALNFIGEPSTTLFRKADVVNDPPNIFGFAGLRIEGIPDLTLWFKLLMHGELFYCSRPLSKFRTHGDQVQSQNREALSRKMIAAHQLLAAYWNCAMLYEPVDQKPNPNLQFFRPLESGSEEWRELVYFPHPDHGVLVEQAFVESHLARFGHSIYMQDPRLPRDFSGYQYLASNPALIWRNEDPFKHYLMSGRGTG